MANQDWEKVKEALKKPPSEEARREAAEAFWQYEQATKDKGSKPTLVSLGYKKAYPTTIPVEDIPGELERNPAFFEHLKEVVEEE